jgi:hypothetical protein
MTGKKISAETKDKAISGNKKAKVTRPVKVIRRSFSASVKIEYGKHTPNCEKQDFIDRVYGQPEYIEKDPFYVKPTHYVRRGPRLVRMEDTRQDRRFFGFVGQPDDQVYFAREASDTPRRRCRRSSDVEMDDGGFTVNDLVAVPEDTESIECYYVAESPRASQGKHNLSDDLDMDAEFTVIDLAACSKRRKVQTGKGSKKTMSKKRAVVMEDDKENWLSGHSRSSAFVH